MHVDVVKLHSAGSAIDATMVTTVLTRAGIRYSIINQAGESIEFTPELYKPEEILDIYISRHDLEKAEMVLRPLLIKAVS